MVDLDLTRLKGGTRADVFCAVQDLDHLGRFIATAQAMVARWFAKPEPDDLRILAGVINSAESAADALRERLSDLVKAEDLDRLDDPVGEVLPDRGKNSPDDDLPGSGEVKTADLDAVCDAVGALCNVAEGANDLATVLDIAMGNHRDGFTPAELAALAHTTYRVSTEIRDTTDRAAAVMAMLDRDATSQTGRAAA